MQSYENQIQGVVNKAPQLLLASMVLSFVLMFSVQMFYYSTIFGSLVPNMAFSYAIGIGIGLMYQIARLSFGLAGALEFSKGKFWTGIFGLAFSFGLTLFEAFEVQEMATYWAANDARIYHSVLIALQAVIWLGLALELRLAFSVQMPSNSSNKSVSESDTDLGNERKHKHKQAT